MPARRSAPGSASATRPEPPDGGEALARLGDGLARAGWAVILAGPDGRVRWVNQAAREGCGWAPGASLGDLLASEEGPGGAAQDGLLMRSRSEPERWDLPPCRHQRTLPGPVSGLGRRFWESRTH